MTERASILLVDHDASTVEAFRFALSPEPSLRLLVADNASDALRIAREERPDLLVVASQVVGTDVYAFRETVRREADLPGTLCVMITDPGSADERVAGLHLGVDEYLTRPLERDEVLTTVLAVLRLKRAQDHLLAERQELAQIHGALQNSFDQLIQLLAEILDMAVPGAADRGRRAADLSLRVAMRFGVPAVLLRDLEVAARLHEVGRLVVPGRGTEDDDDPVEAAAGWGLSSRSVLEKVEGLRGAAEVVEGMFEHWDGTGLPEHVRAGQIPLRSRILRAVVDYIDLLEKKAADPRQALNRLEAHRGTRYDPMVLAHLAAVAMSGGGLVAAADRHVVPIAALRVGMVLAEDLCTDAGLKLLSAETVLTAGNLDVIRRRHRHDPILRGAVVRRAA